MANEDTRGNQSGQSWHGDLEGHREAAEVKKDFNWLPLLLIPVALAIGWFGHDAATDSTREIATENGTQVGVGGGPESTACPSPYLEE